MAEPAARPIRVLAADDSSTIREILARLIESRPDLELVGMASSGHEAVRRATELQPDVVLMDIHMPDLDGIQATWLVSSRAPHGAVIMVTSEERIDFLQRAMSAGAQGYVLKPFGKGEQLFETVRQVHSRSSARRMQVAAGAPLDASLRPRVGKRIAVLGTKGGVGATTVAVSLGVLLRQAQQAPVVLFDADFLGGDAALQLDLRPRHSALDLVPYIDALDAGLIEQVMDRHRDGLCVLAAPANPEQAEVLSAEHVRMLLCSLAQMFEYVVIDTPLTYDDRMLAVLDLADLYVIALTPSLGALRSARHFREVARSLGYPDDRLCFVLNRASTMAGLSLDDIARVLGPVALLQVPSGGAEVTQAANEGRPLILHQPRSAVARGLQATADHVRRRVANQLGRPLP